MFGAETCRSGINILNILFTSHMHFVGCNSFYSSAVSLTSALDGSTWLAPRPGRFTPGKDPVPIV
jgi:hypothetical protein